MERVAVERELGNGQGVIMTRNPNSNHTWSSGIGSKMLYWHQAISKHTQKVVLIFIPKHQVLVY